MKSTSKELMHKPNSHHRPSRCRTSSAEVGVSWSRSCVQFCLSELSHCKLYPCSVRICPHLSSEMQPTHVVHGCHKNRVAFDTRVGDCCIVGRQSDFQGGLMTLWAQLRLVVRSLCCWCVAWTRLLGGRPELDAVLTHFEQPRCMRLVVSFLLIL